MRSSSSWKWCGAVFSIGMLKGKIIELKRSYSPSAFLIENSPISLGLIQTLRASNQSTLARSLQEANPQELGHVHQFGFSLLLYRLSGRHGAGSVFHHHRSGIRTKKRVKRVCSAGVIQTLGASAMRGARPRPN